MSGTLAIDLEWRTPGGQVVTQRVAADTRVVFGRLATAHTTVVLEDVWVARHHARLWRHHSALTLTDLGTDNGTWLDVVGSWPTDAPLPQVAPQPGPALGQLLERGVETPLVGTPVFWIGRLPCRARLVEVPHLQEP